MSDKKILHFEVSPSNVLFINSKTQKAENAFDIHLYKTKAAVDDAKKESEKALAQIVFSFKCGSGKDDLCTLAEAENITFSETKNEWRIVKRTDEDQSVLKILVSPPKDMDFNKDYTAVFHAGNLITTAEQGATIVSITIANFDDVENRENYFSLIKYYPVRILKFEANPASVDLNSQTLLSWETENAVKVSINHKAIGETDAKNDYKLKVEEPLKLQLTATDHKGVDTVKLCEIGVNKPRITEFKASSSSFYTGDKITLSWNVESSSGVSIIPGDGKIFPLTEKCDVYPDNDITYTLFALGYNGQEPIQIPQSITLRKCGWQMINKTHLPKAGSSTKFNDRIFKIGSTFFLFADRKIYESATGETWSERESDEFPYLCEPENYTTVFDGNTLYLLGGKIEGEPDGTNLMYDFVKKAWRKKTMTGNPVNRIFASTYADSLTMYHVILYDKRNVLILGYHDRGNWSVDTTVPLNKDADMVRIAVFNKEIYLALRYTEENKVVISRRDLYDRQWRQAAAFNQQNGEWYHLVSGGNTLYFLNKDGIRTHSDWDKKEDYSHIKSTEISSVSAIDGSVFLSTINAEKEEYIWRYHNL